MFKFEKLFDASGRKIQMNACSAGRPRLLGALAAATLAASGCGVTVQRDLSTANASEVIYDDMCGLQDYFDGFKDSSLAPPAESFAQDLVSDKGTAGGRTRFVFATDFQLHHVKRVLTQNWRRLPSGVPDAGKIELEVRWSEKAGVKRVVTSEDAIMQVGEKQVFLPYHVCLSDLLFGESLYDTRRAFLGLPPPPPSPFAKPVAPDNVDSGAKPGPLASPQSDTEVPVTPVPPTPITDPAPAGTQPAPIAPATIPASSQAPAPVIPTASR